MSLENAPSPNAAQIDYWNSVGGATWAKYHELLDRQINPLGQEALRALDLKSGERVLDLGCGCGPTTVDIAHRVGPSGSVTGVDISAPMLAIAQSRTPLATSGTIEFRQKDIQTDDLGTAEYDATFSRFGLMFFEDPNAAFRNIRKALRPGGRFCLVCWRSLLWNLWMLEPLEAARPILPPTPPPDPLAPGPFAFADDSRVRRILTDAGFTDIHIEPFATLIGCGDVDHSLEVTLRVGPLGRALLENPELLPQVAATVRGVLERNLTPQGVLMKAAVWIVRARNP